MAKKTILGVSVVVALLVVATAAFAFGPGYNRGYGHMARGGGYGGPMMAGYGPGMNAAPVDSKFREETAELRNQLRQKYAELNAVMVASEVDEAKARALQGDINKLRDEMSQKRLAAEVEFRQANPDAAQGWGRGYAYNRGAAYCWR